MPRQKQTLSLCLTFWLAFDISALFVQEQKMLHVWKDTECSLNYHLFNTSFFFIYNWKANFVSKFEDGRTKYCSNMSPATSGTSPDWTPASPNNRPQRMKTIRSRIFVRAYNKTIMIHMQCPFEMNLNWDLNKPCIIIHLEKKLEIVYDPVTFSNKTF